ncbi:MAG: hypothetical protein SF123_01570 [Chloroflexota bacterium]|nr:hypothetical protein [Chloroflexota bacterium]
MAIVVQWDNPERSIIRWDFEPEWTWEELADTARVSSAMIASADGDVDVILHAVDTQPPNERITRYQRSALSYTPSNIRMLVLVAGRQMAAAQVVAPFFEQLEIAETLAHARDMLMMQTA